MCENYLSNECNDVNTSESNLSNECNDVKSSSFNLFDDNGRTNSNTPSSKFCCWYTNADSLRNKLTELKARIDNAQTPPAIIAITEAKPKTTRFNLTQAELNINGYDIFSTNLEGKTGRGIVVYTASYLKAYVVNLSSNFEEYISLSIKLNNEISLIFTCIYRSPSSCATNNARLDDLIREIDNNHHPLKITTGDFNFPSISWDDLHCTTPIPEANNFKKAVLDCYWTQHVDFPTRARGTDNPSCLDYILTNSEELIHNISDLSPLGSSDHTVIQADINVTLKKEEKTYTKYYYDKGDYASMREYVRERMEQIPASQDINQLWDHIIATLEQAQDLFIPSKVTKQSSNPKHRQGTALDHKTIRKIKKKHRSWQRYLETKSGEKYTEYRRLSNQVKKLTKKAKRDAEREIAKEAKTNPKKFWKYVSKKTKIRQGIPDLVYEDPDGNEQSTETDGEKAEVLSEFFSSVFTKEDTTNIPTLPRKKFKQWLSKITVSKEDIKKKLLQLKISKAPGPDRMHPRLLKELSDELTAPLEKIFNASLAQGRLPSIWKEGEISSIFKKGNRRIAGNYRPVSLTCIICKILETLVREEIIKHMRDNNLFSKDQYGFIDRRSTTLQLLYILDEWTEILDDGGTIDAVYMDFMKAFDKVPHERLLSKLEAYGIGGEVMNWIRGFLTNRRQRVRVGDATSTWKDVTSGIPQGSVLGPILFVIYINDMPEALQHNSTVKMFADDSKLYKRTDTDNGAEDLQKDLDNLYQWSNTWQLRFHPEKCKVLSLGNRPPEDIPKLHLYSQQSDGSLVEIPLQETSSEKDIGVFIDNKLTFKDQITSKTNKANTIMGIIRRNFEHLDKTTFMLLYRSLVRPHLEVSNSAWFPILKQDIDTIEDVQRRATRQLPGFRDLDYEQRLRLLGLPSLTYRRLRGDMIETFKIINGHYDPEVVPVIPKCSSSTRGHKKKLYKRRANRLNCRKYYFTLRVVSIWNDLPEEVVTARNVDTFKRRLDKHWRNHPSKYCYQNNPYSHLA